MREKIIIKTVALQNSIFSRHLGHAQGEDTEEQPTLSAPDSEAISGAATPDEQLHWTLFELPFG